AERSLGLAPGRARRFAFERFASHQPHAYAAFRETFLTTTPAVETAAPFALGFDRDEGAVAAARANAARAGLGAAARFEVQPISALSRPEGPPGLVIVNPPYGSRIGAQGPLHGLYAALGARLREVCQGWRVGLVTSEPGLARATGLPWVEPGPPTPHGALKIRLYQAGPL
ncbi:MAG: class I SAM-dependent RNA methyltransferase, partial [Pseudomonadota bacterium]